MELLDNKGGKGAVKEDKDSSEKLNELFSSVFTLKDISKIPIPDPFIPEGK